MNYIKHLFLRDFFSYVALLISGAVLAMLFYFQPTISDDWYYLWQFQDAGGTANFWVYHYKNWSGRLPLIILPSLVFPYSAIEAIYRLFIVMEILALIGLAWYCAVGKNGFRLQSENLQPLLVFGVLLWLALPVRAETVSWLTGNFVYLVPSILGLTFIAWSKYCLSDGKDVLEGKKIMTAVKLPIWFLIGFLAGSSQEQVIAVCMVFSIFNVYRVYIRRELRSVPVKFWISLIGFVVGVLFLVAAPGNDVRLGKISSPSVVEVIERMFLFVPGAFFEIGTGSTGKSIWFGVLIFFLLYFRGNRELTPERIKSGCIWLLLSFVTLFAMFPATNFISPRTSFFAVLFLYIGLASLLCEGEKISRRPVVSVCLFVISLLVLAEATIGLISNISVATEFNRRIAIVRGNHSDQVAVPFIATQPADLTFIQTPEHDRMFLKALSKRVGFNVVHDVQETAPLPNSFKPLKAIKYHNR